MSISFSKNKKKRSSSSSSDTNNSFVKNVTSRMSGLLPAAVTKWFSSPSSSNGNGSAPTADATDSSTEDEGVESPAATQPPPKRMRFSSPGSFNHYAATETNCVNTDITELDPSTFGSVQSPLGRTFRRNFESTPLRPSEDPIVERRDRERSDRADRQERPDVSDRTERSEKTEKESTYKQHSVSTIGSSVATKRKSLFDSPGRAEASAKACAKTACNTIRDPSQPCFKPSLLGSPFYPGRTMYGGAGASYINHPNIKLRRTAQVNDSTSDSTISNLSTSTRKIMDLLEQYSSPISEAKRIPQYTRTPRNSSLSSSVSSTSPPSNKVFSYKTQELHVPSIASILRLKQRSRLMDTTTTARQIIASHSSTSDYCPYPSVNVNRDQQTEKDTSNKLTTKVKSRLTRPKRGDNCDAATEMPAPVNLPSAVLQIDTNNLPQFSFGTPSTTFVPSAAATSTPVTFTVTSVHQTKTTTKTTDRTETPLRKPDIVTSANPFKFSSPVRIPAEPPATTPPKYTFGSPERSIDKASEKKNVDGSPVIGAPKEPASKETEKDWQCADCWVFNKPEKDNCVCCGGKKPSAENKKPAKCTVCKFANSKPLSDKCVNCEKIKINNVIKPIIKAQESSKWKCEDCWVENEASAENCVCCGAKNAKQKATGTVKSDWTCDVCWIKNKSSLDQCAACGAPPPEGKTSSAPQPTITAPKNDTTQLQWEKLKGDGNKWECSSCLVRNDGDRTKCVCCDAEKEGTVKESEKKSFNFSAVSNTSFKFGIFPQAQESTTKPTENKISSAPKKEESETNNNDLPKTPSFTFGLPAKKAEDQTDSAKKAEVKTDTAPKMNFTFGIPKTTSASAAAPAKTDAPTNMFGTPSKLTDFTFKKDEDTEKAQVVPKVDLTVPKTQAPSNPLANMFALPVASQASVEKPAVGIEAQKPAVPVMNCNPAAMKSDSQVPVVSAAPAFSFGTIKLSPNLFGPPATIAPANSISFGTPVQSAPSNTNSLFPKTEPVTSAPSLPVFPKSETVTLHKSDAPVSTGAPVLTAITAPVTAPATAPAPMFSFGSTSVPTQPAPAEKPKFNFTFGSNNKTETQQSLFKPPENKFSFGAPTDKFALPTGNTLGGNGMSAGNALGQNILGSSNGPSTNPLGGATDMSNSITGGSSLQPSNALQTPASGIFGAVVQKDNAWTPPNNTGSNMFGSNAANTTTNPVQKPAFSFGSSTPFSSNNTPAFGANATPNMFGMGSQNANQTNLFASPAQSQPAANVFGSPQAAPALGMFGTPNVGATPTFGTPNPSIPSFETPSLTPAPAPSFSFGQQQQSGGIFGFGQQSQQQQQQQQPQGGSVYSFGASPAGAPQFSMGSAPNMAARRMRKAVRRTPR